MCYICFLIRLPHRSPSPMMLMLVYMVLLQGLHTGNLSHMTHLLRRLCSLSAGVRTRRRALACAVDDCASRARSVPAAPGPAASLPDVEAPGSSRPSSGTLLISSSLSMPATHTTHGSVQQTNQGLGGGARARVGLLDMACSCTKRWESVRSVGTTKF